MKAQPMIKEKRKWKISIQTKMGITLIVLTTLILSGFEIYQYYELKFQKLANLDNLANSTIERLAENLVNPMIRCKSKKFF